jgi:hypothetical protein
MLNSFYAKLSALFLVLIVGLGVVLALLGGRTAQRYADEVEQKLNRTLAQEMVPRFEPLLEDSIDTEAIRGTIKDMTGINRRIEIYLLDKKGTVKASFAPPSAAIKRKKIDMAPVRRFMQGRELPILGDDPRHAGTQKPFSAARIEIMGRDNCYLYVILGSEQYASVAGMIEDSYIIQGGLIGLGLVILVVAGLGLLLFRRLTQRLRNWTIGHLLQPDGRHARRHHGGVAAGRPHAAGAGGQRVARPAEPARVDSGVPRNRAHEGR